MFCLVDKLYFIKLYTISIFLIFGNYFCYFFFYKNYYIYYKFLNFLQNYSIYNLFIFSFFKKSFFSLNLYKQFFNFYFIEYFLDGLYYRVKYYKEYNILGFILGYNHYILYKLPFTIKVIVHMKKRRFFLYSLNSALLLIISQQLVNLKYPNLFKGKGLKIRSIVYHKKLIKKKQK